MAYILAFLMNSNDFANFARLQLELALRGSTLYYWTCFGYIIDGMKGVQLTRDELGGTAMMHAHACACACSVAARLHGPSTSSASLNNACQPGL